MTKFARYNSREIRVMFYNGAGYVVRHDMYPHTHFTSDGPVTRQGNRIVTGIRQGTGRDGGFTFRDYVRPDTEPAWVPPGYQD